MLKKIFSSPSQSISAAAICVAGASFLSRIVGLLRDRLLAHLFGAGNVLDAYYASFLIPDFIYTLLIVGALSVSFIPMFISAYENNKAQAWQLFHTTLIWFGGLLALFGGALAFVAPYILPIIFQDIAPESLALAIPMTRYMLISPCLLGMSAIITGVLQSRRLFLIPSLSPIAYNLGIILGALFLVPMFGPLGLAYGVIFGAFLHFIIQIPGLASVDYVRAKFSWYLPELKTIFLSSLPRIFSLSAVHIQTIIMASFASTLTAGSITSLTLANNLQSFPLGIIGISFAVAAFPTLTQAFQTNQQNIFADELIKTMKMILFLIFPITIIFLLLRMQIVRVVFGTGAFDWQDTITTGNTLAFFAIALFAQCLTPLLSRAFFAMKDTWTPSIMTTISVIGGITVGWYAKNVYGVPGLAMGISVGSLIQLTLLFFAIIRKIHIDKISELIRFLCAITFAGMGMAIIVQILKIPLATIVDMEKFWGILTQGAIAGTIGLLVYILLAILFKVDEAYALKEQFTKKLFKTKPLIKEIQAE